MRLQLRLHKRVESARAQGFGRRRYATGLVANALGVRKDYEYGEG